MSTAGKATGHFIPALSHDALTPACDFLIAFAMPAGRFKSELIDAAAIDSGHRVLDVACGTGTLLQMASFLTEEVGREHVADNFVGLLVPMLHDACFGVVEETARFASIFGTPRTLRAVKSSKRGVA